MAPCASYVICTSPRSGSTLLCGLLAATGKAGDPESHFHKPSLAEWLREYELSDTLFASERDAVAGVVAAARRRGSGETGMFGLRLQRPSFDYLVRQLDILHPGLTSDRARFQAAFGPTRFIHLTRDDKLEQAISLVRARQSGLWHMAPDGTEVERLSPPKEPAFDRQEIERDLGELTAMDAAWKDWFTREGIAPLRLSYAALSADPEAALARGLEYLGLDAGMARGIRPAVAKLADQTSRIWAERFLAGSASQP